MYNLRLYIKEIICTIQEANEIMPMAGARASETPRNVIVHATNAGGVVIPLSGHIGASLLNDEEIEIQKKEQEKASKKKIKTTLPKNVV